MTDGFSRRTLFKGMGVSAVVAAFGAAPKAAASSVGGEPAEAEKEPRLQFLEQKTFLEESLLRGQAAAGVAAKNIENAAIEAQIYRNVDPNNVNPYLRQAIVETWKEDKQQGGNGFIVTDGFRDQAQQQAKIDQGYSSAQFGNSAHNFGKGSGLGLAVDIAPLDANGQPSYENRERFSQLAEKFEAQGKRLGIQGPGGGLESGANWMDPGSQDLPHWQFGHSPSNAEIAGGADRHQWKKNLVPAGQEEQYLKDFNQKQLSAEYDRLKADKNNTGQAQDTPVADEPKPASLKPTPGLRPVSFSQDQSVGDELLKGSTIAKAGVRVTAPSTEANQSRPPAIGQTKSKGQGNAVV